MRVGFYVKRSSTNCRIEDDGTKTTRFRCGSSNSSVWLVGEREEEEMTKTERVKEIDWEGENKQFVGHRK